VDRDANNNVIYGGASEPMSQLFKPGSPYYNADIAGTYGYDQERARALLKEAGVEDLTLTVAVPAVGGPTVKLAEVVQQQLRDVGITLELVPSSDIISQFFMGAQMDMYANQQWRTWTDKFMRTFMPGSTGSSCLPTEPEFYRLVAELRALDPADPATIPLWHHIQAIISDGAYGVFLTMATVDNVWNPQRLGNPAWRRNQVGNAYPDVWKVYIVQPPTGGVGSAEVHRDPGASHSARAH
jgi:peptide/nickel transport system substrate-binding protein